MKNDYKVTQDNRNRSRIEKIATEILSGDLSKGVLSHADACKKAIEMAQELIKQIEALEFE